MFNNICFSLSDDDEGIRSEAEKLWYSAGKQYLIENEEEYKDRIDFSSDALEHYPPQGILILYQRFQQS